MNYSRIDVDEVAKGVLRNKALIELEKAYGLELETLRLKRLALGFPEAKETLEAIELAAEAQREVADKYLKMNILSEDDQLHLKLNFLDAWGKEIEAQHKTLSLSIELDDRDCTEEEADTIKTLEITHDLINGWVEALGHTH